MRTMIRFKFPVDPGNDIIRTGKIGKVFEQLMDLSETIPSIEDYVSGPNNSPEGKSDGYSHGFIMTFADVTARDAYLPHPEHKRFQAEALPYVESVIVFDFEL